MRAKADRQKAESRLATEKENQPNPAETEIQVTPSSVARPTVIVHHATVREVTDHEVFTGQIEVGGPAQGRARHTRSFSASTSATFLQLRRVAIKKAGGNAPKADWAANMPVFYGLSDEEGFPHRARVKSVDDRIDPATGTVRWVAEIPQSEKVAVPGMFARVQLVTGAPYKAIVVPELALGSEQGLKFVYVLNDKNVVQRRYVTVGQSADGLPS